MRFITLTTIAALAIASVFALPVDPSKDVGVHAKDIPLSKRTGELNGNTAPGDEPGNVQSKVGRGTEKVNDDNTPKGQSPLSKRHKKSNGESGSGRKDDGVDSTGDSNPLSKRTEQVNGDLPPGSVQATGSSSTATSVRKQASEPKEGSPTGVPSEN